MVVLVGGPAQPLFEEWLIQPLPSTLGNYEITGWSVTRDLVYANLYESEFKFKLDFKIQINNPERTDERILNRTRKINIQEECRHGYDDMSEDSLQISTDLKRMDNIIACNIRIDKIPFTIGPTIIQGVQGNSMLN